MEYLIGIDGGGSKTDVRCYNVSGELVAEAAAGPVDYHQIGIKEVIQRLKKALSCLPVDVSDCLAAFGMPTYGENKKEDENALAALQKAFSPARLHVENDVTCAWAGAMALSAGVTVVCGTGSMAVGRDPSGKMARSGGWCSFFSDEGSGYWLGRKALELFSKQSDARLPKGALYGLMREHFNIVDDFAADGIVRSQYINSREKLASLQMVVLEACRRGDETAKDAYAQAAAEAALLAAGCARQLDFGDEVRNVSYGGGLFNQKELFLEPFTHELNQYFQANVFPPALSPCEGAVLLALEKLDKEKLRAIREKFLQKYYFTPVAAR